MIRSAVLMFGVLLLASPVTAQSTYVGASFLGEFARYGGIDLDNDAARDVSTTIDDVTRDGESIGFDLRVGRGLGEHWGLELGFARGGTIDNVQTQRISLSGRNPGVILPGLPSLPILPIPDIEFERRFSQQQTTFDTVVWFRQDLTDRVGLIFLGGASFNRLSTEQSLRLTDDRLAIYTTLPAAIETVSYGVGPVAGADAAIGFGTHAAITAGVRLHALSGGWLIRPGVGVRWSF